MYRLLTLLALANCSYAYAADVIAHRGYGCGIQDNSIEGIRMAWGAGVDAIELDVRVSADGIAYLFHDDEIGEKLVNDLSFDEVSAITSRNLVALSNLTAIPVATGFYLLDLKTVDTASVDSVLDALHLSDVDASRVSFQSDDLTVLRRVREIQPQSKLYYLSRLEWRIPYLIPPSARSLVKLLRSARVDGVSIKGRSFVGRRFINILQSAGFIVNVWTINEPKRIDHYRRAGADAIITDSVARLTGGPANCSS